MAVAWVRGVSAEAVEREEGAGLTRLGSTLSWMMGQACACRPCDCPSKAYVSEEGTSAKASRITCPPKTDLGQFGKGNEHRRLEVVLLRRSPQRGKDFC